MGFEPELFHMSLRKLLQALFVAHQDGRIRGHKDQYLRRRRKGRPEIRPAGDQVEVRFRAEPLFTGSSTGNGSGVPLSKARYRQRS